MPIHHRSDNGSVRMPHAWIRYMVVDRSKCNLPGLLPFPIRQQLRIADQAIQETTPTIQPCVASIAMSVDIVTGFQNGTTKR